MLHTMAADVHTDTIICIVLGVDAIHLETVQVTGLLMADVHTMGAITRMRGADTTKYIEVPHIMEEVVHMGITTRAALRVAVHSQ